MMATSFPTTAYPLPRFSFPVPANRFAGHDKNFRFEDYGLKRPDYDEVSPSLWMPYFSGNSNTQVKPHSLVILA